ncbi:hypothetical protein [Flagellimonas olearia]|nr:hypothetical protein [Allomuricauda olearia]
MKTKVSYRNHEICTQLTDATFGFTELGYGLTGNLEKKENRA